MAINQHDPLCIKRILKLLDVEFHLGDLEPGDLIYFAQTKMTHGAVSAEIPGGPGRFGKPVTVILAWNEKDAVTGMFLNADAYHMRFLVEDRIYELKTEYFGLAWTVRKIVR